MAQSDSSDQFDQRTVHRYISAGRISRADYAAFLDGMPDLADLIMDRDEGGDDDGFDAPPAPKASADAVAEAPAAAAPVAPPSLGAPIVGAPVPPAVAPVAPAVAPPSLGGPSGDAPPPPPMEMPIGPKSD